MNDTDLAFAPIGEIGKLFRRSKLSPVELTKLVLARIELLNPRLNAYLTVTTELALAQAKKAEADSVLRADAKAVAIAARFTEFRFR